jgi:predicted RecB family nuclease
VALTFPAIEVDFSEKQFGKREMVPVLFVANAKITQHDKLLAAIHGHVLTEIYGQVVRYAKIIHGPDFCVTSVNMTSSHGSTLVTQRAHQALLDLENIANANASPPIMLNRHCEICEFRKRCVEEATRNDDLSLLRSLNPCEIQTLHRRGVFTVTQLAFTFRAKSVACRDSRPLKHSKPLQASAIRDKKVYITTKPELPLSPTRIYLDVEGSPDRDFYYLIT